MLTFEEFVYQSEWFELIRLSQFVSEHEVRRSAIKRIREHKRGRPLFGGPYGDHSQWAGMCHNWYKQYLGENQIAIR